MYTTTCTSTYEVSYREKSIPEKASSPRDPLGDHYDIWWYKCDGHAARKKPRVGFCGAMILYNNDQYVPINMFRPKEKWIILPMGDPVISTSNHQYYWGEWAGTRQTLPSGKEKD